MRRSSTLLTRLALALLAVMGFGAPLAAREADGVVQIARGKASPAVPVAQRSVRLERRLPVERARATAQRTLARVQSAGRRYLHHRAWLI